jgi:hypothetical protein
MTMLSISLRTAKLGPSINNRTQKHGDEDVPAVDISVGSVILEPEELNAILGNPKAHERLFVQTSAGGRPEPFFDRFDSGFTLADKFEGANVRIEYGLQPIVVDLPDVKIARVYLEPLSGGQTRMSFQIQASHDWTERSRDLVLCMNREIKIEVAGAEVAKKTDKNQAQLPLGAAGDTGKEPEPKHPEDLFKDKRGRSRRTPASAEVN